MKERKINYSIFESRDFFSYEATTDCTIRKIKKIQAGYCSYLKDGNLNLHSKL